MSVIVRILFRDFKLRLQVSQKIYTHAKEKSEFATLAVAPNFPLSDQNPKPPSDEEFKTTRKTMQSSEAFPREYRQIYPEFLPDPRPEFRNSIRERLERKDMLARRSLIDIPEFYVGSVMAITHSDIHAPGKSNRFVGICIRKQGCGLRAAIILRNIVDGQGVEVDYDLYDPCVKKIECLRLEKRLDDDLLYLRDAPPQFSTVSFELEPELITEKKKILVNSIKVPLKPQPWVQKYELKDYKGIKEDTIIINRNRAKKADKAQKPWEKYDLMKVYRKTIPEEEQQEIFSEICSELNQLQIVRQKQKRARLFIRPKKTG